MGTSKLIIVSLAALIAVATAGWIVQRNLGAQKEELQTHTEHAQARPEQLSAANFPKQREIQLASRQELPDVVVSAARYAAAH